MYIYDTISTILYYTPTQYSNNSDTLGTSLHAKMPSLTPPGQETTLSAPAECARCHPRPESRAAGRCRLLNFRLSRLGALAPASPNLPRWRARTSDPPEPRNMKPQGMLLRVQSPRCVRGATGTASKPSRSWVQQQKNIGQPSTSAPQLCQLNTRRLQKSEITRTPLPPPVLPRHPNEATCSQAALVATGGRLGFETKVSEKEGHFSPCFCTL